MTIASSSKIAALCLAALLAVPLLAGCDSGTSGDSSATDDSSTESSGVVIETYDDSDLVTEFDYSGDLDENGYWKGVTALDYVTLCDYSSIEIPVADVLPTDEEVQEQVDAFVEVYETTDYIYDRAVEDGDTVNIDYVGTIDGVEFDCGSTEGYGTTVTIGVTNYIDGFLDQLIGHEPGEVFDIYVTFPEDYGIEELNGQDAVFSTTINYISETTIPELTDEWVSETYGSVYGWSTVDDMREDLMLALEENNIAVIVQDYVTENSTITEVPDIIVTYQENLLIWQYQYYADIFGIDLEDMLLIAAGVSTADELISDYREAIDLTAASYLVFQAIAEDAGITVDDSDISEYFEYALGVTDLSQYEDYYGKPYLALCALVQEVEDLLMGNVVLMV